MKSSKRGIYTTIQAEAQQGFTIVELVVVMMLTLIFSGMIMSFAIDFWGSATSLSSSNETLITRQNAGDTLRDQLNRATGLIMQNSVPDPNTEVPDPAQASGSYWLPLHAVPKTISMPVAGSFAPVFYYTAPSTDRNHIAIMKGEQPYYDEFVLYLDGSKKELLLRNLVNTSASSNRLHTTCPESTVTSTCGGDRIVARNVYSVGVKYFSRSGNQINYASIVDPNTGGYIGPDFPAVEVVEVTINLKKPAVIHGTNDTTNATIIRVALRNG